MICSSNRFSSPRLVRGCERRIVPFVHAGLGFRHLGNQAPPAISWLCSPTMSNDVKSVRFVRDETGCVAGRVQTWIGERAACKARVSDLCYPKASPTESG